MTRILDIVSAKGGVGKTTTVANLGAALVSKFNKEVVILDFNFSASNLALSMGLYNTPVTINHVLSGHSLLSEAIYIHPSGLRIIPASLCFGDFKVDTGKLKREIKKTLGFADFVLLDSAPGLTTEAVNSLDVCDDALIVSTPHVPSLVNSSRTFNLAKTLGVNVLGLALTRVKSKSYEYGNAEVQNIIDTPILAKIPEDDRVLASSNKGLPVVLKSPHSPASVAYTKLACTLLDEEYSPSLMDSAKQRFFSVLKHS